MSVKIEGLNEVVKNLNNEIEKIKSRTKIGVWEASGKIRLDALEITPIDEGNLRASSYLQEHPMSTTISPIYEVGYTADYAAKVHEMPMTLKGKPRKHFGKTRKGKMFGGGTEKGFYWDSGENKFLEKSVNKNKEEVLRIIQKHAKIEGV